MSGANSIMGNQPKSQLLDDTKQWSQEEVNKMTDVVDCQIQWSANKRVNVLLH